MKFSAICVHCNHRCQLSLYYDFFAAVAMIAMVAMQEIVVVRHLGKASNFFPDFAIKYFESGENLG